ncbi:hypothetical protein ACOMHN_014576 [Nucella lapillus]
MEDFFLLQEAREGEQCVQSEDQESGEGGEEFGAASPATSVSSLSSLSDSEEEGEECLTLSLVSSVPSLSVQIADLQSPDDLPSDEDQREPESTAHLSARPAAPEEEEEELLDYEEEMALQLPQEEYLDMGWDRQLPEWVGRVEDFFLLQEAREGEQCVQSEDQESGEGGEEFGAASPATSVSSLSSLSDSEEEGEECLTLSLVSSVPSLSVQIADLQSPDDLPSDEDQREPESTAHLSARPAAPEEEEEELLDYEEEMALQLPQEEYLDMGWDRQLPEVEDFFLLQEAREGEQCVQSEDQESGEGGEEFGAASPATSVSSLSSLSDSEEEGEECLTPSLVSSVPSLSVQIADLQSPDDLPSDEDQREPESTAHLSARPAAPEEEEEELLDYEEEMALQLPQEEYLDMGWDRQLPEWVGRVEDFFLLQEAREGEQCVQSEDQESGEGGEEFGAASPATSVSSLSSLSDSEEEGEECLTLSLEAREGEQCVQSEDQESGEGGEEFGAASPATSVSSLSSLSDSEEEGEECLTLSLVSSVSSLSVQIADLQSPDDLPSDEDQREPESTAHLSARPAAPEEEEEELLDYEEEMALQLPQEEYLDIGWDRQLHEWVGRVEDFFLLQEAREGEQCVQSEDQESEEGGEEFGAASPATSVSSLSSLSDSEEEGEVCLTLSLVSSVPSLSVQIADLQSPDDLPSDEDQREPESTAHLSARPAAPEEEEEELLDYEEEMALQLPQEEYLDMGWDRQLPEWVGR